MSKIVRPALSTDQHFQIMGAGPVGCYLAYKLLSKGQSRVSLFDGNNFARPQVIRIPFAIAVDLPQIVRKELWPDEKTRARIFNPIVLEDSDDWPRLGYNHWPWVSIRSFQEIMIRYLSTRYACIKRFVLIPLPCDFNELQKMAGESPEKNLFFCTCGNQGYDLRKKLHLLDGKTAENKGPGIYLIYQNKAPEDYQRDGKPLSYQILGENGISYAATNNQAYDVQLYTYPAGDLLSVFENIPQEFKEKARFGVKEEPLNMTGLGLSADSLPWFDSYKKKVMAEVSKAGIQLPADLTRIQVFYAARSEYYWNTVATKIQTKGGDIPLFFVGDSAGSTDYKLGLSLGRGLLAVQKLSKAIFDNDSVSEDPGHVYQRDWNRVLDQEFNKGPQVTSEPWIQYQYLVKGREINFAGGRQYLFASDEDYVHYLDEYQHLFPDFVKTSEANAVVYMNTTAIKTNIEKIAAFAQQTQGSKIMAVVKSDGYGIGDQWMATQVLESGIDFLAVAKLQEAIALRKTISRQQARIIVFDSPLPHDLTAYAVNQIEVLLPPGKNSEVMIRNWLQKSSLSLKVHIMVDTGMRRDGGLIANLPEAILSMLDSLQRPGIVFAGLATHIACYRCTDYRGEALVNFRMLQLKRFKQVSMHLLAKGIEIPLVHVGGGLSLLAEEWPHYFTEYAKSGKTELYTRVGHGLYGMESQQDIPANRLTLHPVVSLNLQVRNVFYVEEDEPVSYGGHWRAPEGGVWIATISGGWADGMPRTSQTLGESQQGVCIGINGRQYPVVGTINMNAMMVNLGASTTIRPGDRAVVFGWREWEPKLQDLARLSGQISPSILTNVPAHIIRIPVSEPIDTSLEELSMVEQPTDFSVA